MNLAQSLRAPLSPLPDYGGLQIGFAHDEQQASIFDSFRVWPAPRLPQCQVLMSLAHTRLELGRIYLMLTSFVLDANLCLGCC